MWVSGKIDLVALDPALQVRARLLALVLAFDRRRRLPTIFMSSRIGMDDRRWRRHARRDPRKLRVREVGLRTREVEIEVDRARHAWHLPSGRVPARHCLGDQSSKRFWVAQNIVRQLGIIDGASQYERPDQRRKGCERPVITLSLLQPSIH